MDLGAFSVSLAVKDMAVSRAFYERLGFAMTGGDGQTWTIVGNGSAVIGLFQGMFESNILTFNPGWTSTGATVHGFTDIRVLGEQLERAGLELRADTTGDSAAGPASFMLTDPDGNDILVDQHV